jgi:UDPglucose 6-dehydrogenase
MKICVIGTGYVGLITGCGFAKLGHSVFCVDIDKKKVERINKKIPPIYEEGLQEIMNEVVGKNLTATTDLKAALAGAEIVFIGVGTPSRKDGSIDLSYIDKSFLDTISLIDSFKAIIVKSTVVPGTTDRLEQLGKKAGKIAGKDYGLCMSPEFLREGMAVYDFFNPDRLVIGAQDEQTMKKVSELYKNFKCPIIKTDRRTAEMIKYASNSLLATKISFANEIGNLCKALGIDVYEVMDAAGLDSRINRRFLNAGVGYGGSCFPKDVKAIVALFREKGIEPKLLQSVLDVNEGQPHKLVEIARKKVKLKGAKVSVLGLAFKPDSDDMREAPSIKIIGDLLAEGAKVKAYDPQAVENAKAIFEGKIEYAKTLHEALDYSGIIFVVTEWKEFKNEALYSGKMVFDGRKVLKKKSGKSYEGVCW